MSQPAGSITRLIPNVLDRDDTAIQELWNRYVARIEGLARPLLAGLPPGAGDEQDVAQSAFFAFCEAAANGQAPQLDSRGELWRLLATISRHKATDRVRRELRQRRGGSNAADAAGLQNAATDDERPSQVVQLQETLDDLMLRLNEAGDPMLETIARMRLQGATNQEIAERLDCTQRTIQRKLHILERLWTETLND
jgi:DNA-directed RNA polymerase specialized sigma24 family protein